jgi:hypothetical protein
VLGAEKNGISAAQEILIALYKRAKSGDVRAAEVLLDRGWGKTKQDVNIQANIGLSDKPIVFE